MKSLKIVFFTLLIASFVLAGTALAGQREGAFSLSPMVGYHVFEGDQNTDDAFSGGFALGYNVTKHWAAEIDLHYTPTETDMFGPADVDVDVWTFGMNALYHFNPEGTLVPYVTAGFGGMVFSADNSFEDKDYMMNWGVGAKYFVSKDMALRLEARHVIDLHSDRDWDRDSTDSDKTDNNLLALAGLYWQFGGAAEPTPPPADSDGDGIPDIRDKCPDTPFGVMVDAVGCPPAPKPVPQPAPAPPVAKPAPAPVPVTKEIITFNLLFDFDKHDIKEEMIPVLEQAKSILDEDPVATFMVLGHTCSIGTNDYNQGLSERRANSVKSWLVNNGIKAERLEAIGYGESQPKYDNGTREGRKNNRRVELLTH